MTEKNLLAKSNGTVKPIDKIRDFQRRIYQKAKQEPNYRFYVLYDKICRYDFLTEAYKRVRSNRGAAGIDGQSFKDIEKEIGLTAFLLDIQKDIRARTYRPEAVKRVYIPKANGKERPLGIPTIRDRVVQMSCKMVIEPIFEADFKEVSFGFRPKRSAKDAVKRIKDNLKAGYTQVYDADLSKFFDTIPHAKLMKLIAQRISDKHTLHLIKLWLKAPVNENGRMGGGKRNKLGTPQGGVISPLLANIYLNLLDEVSSKWEAFRYVKLVRYADDFVLMGKEISHRTIERLKYLLGRMELHVNDEKTKLINAAQVPLSFLGFEFQYRPGLPRQE